MDLFENISPIDYRYYGRDRKVKDALEPYLSENAYIIYKLKVEAALAEALAKEGICSKEIADDISKACDKVTATEVYKEEDRIKHDIRALANCIRAKVSKKARRFVHFSLTSYDVVDTANVLRYKKFCEKVLLPALLELEKTWIEIALREKDTLQVGRTHGQHAEPITFGFTMASYINRLGGRIEAIISAEDALRGKISGAVGAYNASSLFFKNPVEFEKNLLETLGLKPALHSTQIAAPEPMTDLMHSVVSAFAVLANFSDDMRNLQRTEIAEVKEEFSSEQVGSSTMPHKRNPINFENVKSMYKAFMPSMVCAYLDEISEHQRDLTNSASQRFIPQLFAAFYVSVVRLSNVSKRLVVDRENLEMNFDMSKEMVAAEPLYMLLALHGHPDAHEFVRKLTLKAEKEETGLRDVMEIDDELEPYLNKFSDAEKEILFNPELYTGMASQKTEMVCEFWKNRLQIK
ncbi:MAG: adenylosuccinate lyase [Candidatus Aenigmarchaeota archaeon]|nr:adenylosuccinate lyase [Candidatus Aenigmarchaeota archaeon]